MRKIKFILLIQSILLLALIAAVLILFFESIKTHEAIRLVCRYLAGG